MLKRLSHSMVYVLDQNRALDFYTQKLGLEVREDATMGDFRWLTVGVPGQPELEIALMEPKVGMMYDEESVAHLRALIAKGVLGGGAFDTEDCQATYEALKARGVEFHGPPEKQPWGLAAVFKDDSGNFFSLSQP
jgi:predicted enzyme related to lactoylglutathione lyase